LDAAGPRRIPQDFQAVDRRAERQLLDQHDAAREPNPLLSIVGIAEADLRQLHREAAEVERRLLRQLEPSAVDVDMAVLVDRQLLHVHFGPVEAPVEQLDAAADLDEEVVALFLERKGGDTELENTRLRELDETI